MNKDILNISDLVSGYENEGDAAGGFLRLDPVTQNNDGTTTLQLIVGSESVTAADSVSLATIVMATGNAADSASFTQQIFEQLLHNNDIVF